MYAISEKDVPGQGRHWKKIQIGELVESQIMTAGGSEMESCIKVRSPDKVGQPEKKRGISRERHVTQAPRSRHKVLNIHATMLCYHTHVAEATFVIDPITRLEGVKFPS